MTDKPSIPAPELFPLEEDCFHPDFQKYFKAKRFLTAIELAFSCCIGDAYSVLRDGIESVAHAHKIFKEPAAAGRRSAEVITLFIAIS
jgi:hypothetical protein